MASVSSALRTQSFNQYGRGGMSVSDFAADENPMSPTDNRQYNSYSPHSLSSLYRQHIQSPHPYGG